MYAFICFYFFSTNPVASLVLSTLLTLQCGERLLITVDYDGLLRCGGTVLASRMVLIVKTLHVKLQMAIAVKPEIVGKKQTNKTTNNHYHFIVKYMNIYDK